MRIAALGAVMHVAPRLSVGTRAEVAAALMGTHLVRVEHRWPERQRALEALDKPRSGA